MSLYTLVLFVHILAAIVLVGGTLLAPVLHGAIRRVTEVSDLRNWARLHRRVSAATGPSAGLVLAAGVYLTLSGWSFAEGWILVSLVLFATNGAVVTSVLDPHARRLLVAAEEAAEGRLGADLVELVHDGRVIAAQRLLVGTDVAIVFLMVNKPGWAGSLAVAATGLALGAALAAVSSRRIRPAVPAGGVG